MVEGGGGGTERRKEEKVEETSKKKVSTELSCLPFVGYEYFLLLPSRYSSWVLQTCQLSLSLSLFGEVP